MYILYICIYIYVCVYVCVCVYLLRESRRAATAAFDSRRKKVTDAPISI